MYWTIDSLWFAKWIIKRDNIDVSEELLDRYFIWDWTLGTYIGVARIWVYTSFMDQILLITLKELGEIFKPIFIIGRFYRGIRGHGSYPWEASPLGAWLFKGSLTLISPRKEYSQD